MASPAPKSLSLKALAYVLAICAAILAFEGWREWSAHDAALAKARHEARNLARSMRQHAEDTYEIAEQAVGMVAYELGTTGTDAAGLGRAEAFMLHLLEGSPRLAELTVYDATGRWLVSTAASGPEVEDRSADDVFARHRDSDTLAAAFAEPVPNAAGDALLTTVSRRLEGPSRRFAGIVVATIDSRYFNAVHGKVDVGPRGAITLYDHAGHTLTGEPFTSPIASSSVALFGPRPGSGSSGDYEFIPAADGVARIAGFDRGARYPVTAVVAVSRDEALADWRHGALLRGIATLVFTLAIAGLGLRATDQFRRRLHSDAVLKQKEGEFRLLAESASDLVERFAADGTRTYISPAVERLTGETPGELLGRNAFDVINDEDRPAVEAAAERLRQGESEQETVAFRRLRRDGREIWLETSLRVAAEPSGQFSVVGVTRDITDRKELELRLEGMALRDGLTELANRRAFDTALAREVALARRTGTPLSLLMIDADRFKRFNDDHGHLAGDACLKSIAVLMARAARRPADVAARFGGEELALLLPATDLAAARAIGVDLCRQVEALAIPHPRNLPWAVATVSIGVATLDPRREDAVPEATWLLGTADLALYDAKAQGRNQCIAGPRRFRSRLVG
ncbi:MAG: diguanylate cyclase [Devosia sp.]|uniref:sensor domain-containing diguanylate cyclase n=1 Tax=Devosia sp. TaxID=1871048 RepID=UPI001AC5BCAD|nr:diguanylate cyclase [Devosia sp.]MBN9316035.1 diguanylate cyclase [Devosia sp.]